MTTAVPERKNNSYYLENRDIIIANARNYQEENKEAYLLYQKRYRDENRQNINNKAREKIKCCCGAMVNRANMPRHRKSAKHMKYINNLDNQNPDE